MSISLSISEVRAIISASHHSYTTYEEVSLWEAALKVDTEWDAFKRVYDGYVLDLQASMFVEMRARLKTLKEAIRSYDEALAKSTSK